MGLVKQNSLITGVLYYFLSSWPLFTGYKISYLTFEPELFIRTAHMGTRSVNTGPNVPKCKLETNQAQSVFLTATAFSRPFGELGLSFAQCTPLTHSAFYGVSIHGVASHPIQLEFSLHMRQEHWTGGVSRLGFKSLLHGRYGIGRKALT